MLFLLNNSQKGIFNLSGPVTAGSVLHNLSDYLHLCWVRSSREYGREGNTTKATQEFFRPVPRSNCTSERLPTNAKACCASMRIKSNAESHFSLNHVDTQSNADADLRFDFVSLTASSPGESQAVLHPRSPCTSLSLHPLSGETRRKLRSDLKSHLFRQINCGEKHAVDGCALRPCQ